MNFNLNITDILNLPIKIMSALTLASGSLLLLPSRFLKQLHLTTFINKYGFIIGLVFIISLSILIITLVIQIFNFISEKRSIRNFYKNAESRLRKLSPFEICIVLRLFENENYTSFLPINDGAVQKLENQLVISKTTNQYMVTNPNTAKFPYLLQPWVVEELIEKEDLLEFFENKGHEFLQKKENQQLVYDLLIRPPDF
ncbi:superinfection exclusion B family protein [Enterococcus casseliflavus]|nr:superinfection exclusion B family protein [Enterococcus casseliflavus]